MRVLGIGETCDLGALYLRLKAEGHDVRVAVAHPLAQGTLAGMVDKVVDWRAQLDWIEEAGGDGIILFEAVSEGLGLLQDRLRGEGFHVVGGSAYGDRLENDRVYAQRVLGDVGLSCGRVWSFRTPDEACGFIAMQPGRYVLKRSGAGHAAGDTYVGQMPDGRDVAAVLAASEGGPRDIVLMEFIEGVEMGVGAYFNGTEFLRPACLDWEHKRFFAGDMGEMTGEMGTVATFRGTDRFFDATLGRIAPLLRRNGHVGYVNLNTIVNDAGVWPLEFTCRFGYPGFAILSPLQLTSWGDLLRAMVGGAASGIETADGYAVGIVLSTPPFPYSREDVDEVVGLPVILPADLDPRHLHYGEVGLDPAGQLVTSGLYGWTLVITGMGATIARAQAQAYRNASGVFTPNRRYRLDIGDRLIAGDYAELQRLGHLPSHSPTTAEPLT